MPKSRRAFIKQAGAVSAMAASGLTVAGASPQKRTDDKCAGANEMKMQCVVTGRDKPGKSVIVSHAPFQPVTVTMLPGYEFYRVWGSDSRSLLPSDGTPPQQPTYFPAQSGFRFGIFTIPPAISARSTAPPAPSPSDVQEIEQKLPGLLEYLEPDHPGMHTTETVDFDVVIFGEVVLELDDGAEVLLKAGDCVIQNGTRHAWHNRSSEKCVIAFSLLGADHKQSA